MKLAPKMNKYSLEVNGVFYLLRDMFFLIKNYVNSAENSASKWVLNWVFFMLDKNKTLVQKL